MDRADIIAEAAEAAAETAVETTVEATAEMTAEAVEKAAFDAAVKESVDAGIAPLELQFYPIVACDTGSPIAYRTKTVIHSVLVGEMAEKDYTYVSDVRDCGVELLKHSLQHAVTALKAFEAADRKIGYLTVRCPGQIVETQDLYRVISGVLQKNPTVNPRKLCLEFPADLMAKDTEKAHIALLDMKVLKVRTAIVGCGDTEFPISKLLTVTPDMVFLHPDVAAWVGSRDKPQLFNSLVSYIKSMGVDVVAQGTEEIRKRMRNSDCDGFLPITEGNGLLLADAVAQKEETD